MSEDDVVAERDRLAGAVSGRSGLPLLGMTWGTDGTWSASAWGRAAPFTYETRRDPGCPRRPPPIGSTLSFHPVLRPEPAELPAQVATLSVWGAAAQADIARARVGIVGLGSVGSIVAEGLSRMGVSDIVLIDHDRIEIAQPGPHPPRHLEGRRGGDLQGRRRRRGHRGQPHRRRASRSARCRSRC